MESPLHDLPEAIIILDIDNQIIGVNPVGEQLLKMNRTDLIGKSVEAVFPRLATSENRNKTLVDGRKETSLCRGDGQKFYAEITLSTIFGLNRKFLGRVVLVRENLRSQRNNNKEESLRLQNMMLGALQETTFDLHTTFDLNVVLHNIVERACNLLETSHGYLAILDETSNELTPVVGIGVLDEVLGYKIKKGEGVAGTVWKTEKYIIVEDYDTWEGRSEGFSYGTIRSIIGMPLKLNEKIVGVFGIAHGFDKDIVFSNEDAAILSRFADLAVVALQNARLFEQAQKEIEFRRKTEIELRNANQLLQFQIERVELLQGQLEELAVRDPLTELYNRRYLQEALELEFEHPERSGLPLAILMIDSDHLKEVNDKYGHKAGDDFLVYIAKEIQRGIRAGDIACRYGGDEFVVVLSNVSEKIAIKRAEKLRKTIAAHHIIHRNDEVGISVSIGIAMFPAHGKVGEELLHKADQALYAAKRMGKNKVNIYSEELKS